MFMDNQVELVISLMHHITIFTFRNNLCLVQLGQNYNFHTSDGQVHGQSGGVGHALV